MALASELHGPRRLSYGSAATRDYRGEREGGMMHDEPVKSSDVDRRGSRRLELRLPVELRMADGEASTLVRTITRNISTGGLYVELDRADFSPGDRLNIELTVPPAEGVSPYPGRASCTAEVVRCTPLAADSKTNLDRVGIAARFLDRLRITY
ncbi:MAG: PilZ domain-containing protein [Planctomycetes bacterium]|nr:PilZ domain-containing protein [Planctomycetota bacterium]